MKNETVLNIAELRMHLRDEHVCKDVKNRLKRHYGIPRSSSTTHSATAAAAGTANTVAVSLDRGCMPSATSPATASAAMVPAAIDHVDGAPVLNHDASMRQIAVHLTNIARDDRCVVDGETIAPASASSSQPGRQAFSRPISITLKDLIDGSANYWQELHKKSAVRSLDEELEFYELLDMDAEGETDNTGDNGAYS